MPDPHAEPPFALNTLVRRRSRPDEIGPVLRCRINSQTHEWRVTIFVRNQAREVPAYDLVRFDPTAARTPFDEARAQAFAAAPAFHTTMTLHRLRKPATELQSAFGTARVRFYPYQFKPVLKFLENPNHRLLVADDVGLGKTIEAGYILREWRARYPLEHVLIVVPARLRTKWRDELRNRFGEQFDIVRRGEMLRHLSAARRNRPIEPFLWVTSYESVRDDDVIDAFDEIQPSLDLAIFDEAHRVRNTPTAQHRFARAVTTCADSLVFLTATPTQTSVEDLWVLLDLLEPGRFGRRQDFQERIEANRPVLQATTLASAGRTRQAAQVLRKLEQNSFTAATARLKVFKGLVRQLERTPEPTRAQRVAFQRAISDFGLTSQVVSRTRKTDVMSDWPMRDPTDLAIELSPDEQAIYNAVWDIAGMLYTSDSSWGRLMSALMAYRYTASSIPAAVSLFRERLQLDRDPLSMEALAGETDEDRDDESFEEVPRGRRQEALVRLRTVLGRCPAPEHDSKLRALTEALEKLWKHDDDEGVLRRKVVLFSYFKRTLAYLRRELGKRVPLRMIHGGVAIDEREQAIAEFLEDPEILVLLSSEVGGEGLDLQRASVVVNYDLPWNPMVVEQRIGRIDRIGQEAERLVVLNLFTKGTVEERIIHRLYRRLDIFRASVGEIEPILGEREVTQLVIDDLRRRLSEEQLQEQVERTADAARRAIQQAEALSRNGDRLLAADQGFLDEVSSLVEQRRVPLGEELFDLLGTYLRHAWPGHRISGDPLTGVGTLRLPAEARVAFGQFAQRRGSEASRIAGRLMHGSVEFTFDADVAMRRTRVEFFQARHPIIQWVRGSRTEDENQPSAFALRISASENVPRGAWLLGVRSLVTTGTRRDNKMVAVALNLESGDALSGDDAQPMLTACLSSAEPLDPCPLLPQDVLDRALDILQDRLDALCDRLDRETREIEQRRWETRRASWETTLTQRVRAEEARLRALEERGAAESILRMRRGALRKRREELAAKMEEFEQSADVMLDADDICVAIVLADLEGEYGSL